MVCRKVLIQHISHAGGVHFRPRAKLIDVAERAIELCNEGRQDTIIRLKEFSYGNGTITAKRMATNYHLWDFIETNEDTV